jgi:hypothetical protein
MRTLHRLWARLFGYFWLPCDHCGRCVGGHERGWQARNSQTGASFLCPRCAPDAAIYDYGAVRHDATCHYPSRPCVCSVAFPSILREKRTM